MFLVFSNTTGAALFSDSNRFWIHPKSNKTNTLLCSTFHTASVSGIPTTNRRAFLLLTLSSVGHSVQRLHDCNMIINQVCDSHSPHISLDSRTIFKHTSRRWGVRLTVPPEMWLPSTYSLFSRASVPFTSTCMPSTSLVFGSVAHPESFL